MQYGLRHQPCIEMDGLYTYIVFTNLFRVFRLPIRTSVPQTHLQNILYASGVYTFTTLKQSCLGAQYTLASRPGQSLRSPVSSCVRIIR